MSTSRSLDSLEREVAKFAADRDWDQFHTPKNLTMALAGEVGELIEHFQWLAPEESKNLDDNQREVVGAEVADVFIYLIRLAQKLDLDLVDVASKKIKLNELRYPADKVRGSAQKYTEYEPK